MAGSCSAAVGSGSKIVRTRLSAIGEEIWLVTFLHGLVICTVGLDHIRLTASLKQI